MKVFLQGSKYVYAANTGISFPYISSIGPLSGTIRYNSNGNKFEVYDGVIWHSIPDATFSISMSPDAEEAIAWAQRKMQEEKQIDQLAAKYSCIKDAQEQLSILVALLKERSE